MRAKVKQEILNEILSELGDEQNGNLPGIRAPQGNLLQRERERHGLLASVLNLIDPVAWLEKQHRHERIRTELETGTALVKVKSEEALQKARIHQETIVKAYKDEAEQWLEGIALKNRGQAIIAQHGDFRELAEAIMDMGLEEKMQKKALARLVRVYFGRNGDAE